jgi:hypothetical protein
MEFCCPIPKLNFAGNERKTREQEIRKAHKETFPRTRRKETITVATSEANIKKIKTACPFKYGRKVRG